MNEEEKVNNRLIFRILSICLFVSGLLFVGCSGFQVVGGPSQLELTQTSMVMKQTQVSMYLTETAMSLPAQQPSPNAPLANTPVPAVPVEPTDLPRPLITEPPPAPEEKIGFEDWKKSANILLYEDMVAVPKALRYVKATLDRMGMPYTDVGNAQGWLKERLLFGGEGGAPWDLVIIALENRCPQISGEFFTLMREWMNKGTSVIIESWYLEKIQEGYIRPIVQECGVYLKNYGGGGTMMDLVLWPLVEHPVLTSPNNYLKFTKGDFFWYGDIGDMMDLTGKGDAVLLIGRKETDTTHNGALAVCLGGQLTLQTFSSHNYPREIMEGAWENYIENALLIRYNGRTSK